MTEREFLTIKEVSDIFGVHKNTIYNAVKRGFIIAVRIGDCKKSPYRISRRSLDAIHSSIIFQHSQKSKTLT